MPGGAVEPASQTPRGALPFGPRPGVAALMLAASLVNLPVVYFLLNDGAPPPLTLLAGLLAMGLGWGAGLLIEDRRTWLAAVVAGVGALEIGGALALNAGDALRAGLATGGALSAAAFAALVAQRK